jgi:mRNA-degrading endonuclease RelE of RelBE toxin-antitoxin system
MTKRIRKRLKDKPKAEINLTSMSAKELRHLKAKVDFLLTNSTEEIDDNNYQFFYTLLTKKLHDILRTKYQPYPIFKKQKLQYKKLVEVVDYLDEFLESMFEKPKRIYYRKLYRMYINQVIGNIQDSPLPLEVSVILNYKNKFAAILDNNFPGYLENGMLKVIFQRNLK